MGSWEQRATSLNEAEALGGGLPDLDFADSSLFRTFDLYSHKLQTSFNG
jgi:hypothetical protein